MGKSTRATKENEAGRRPLWRAAKAVLGGAEGWTRRVEQKRGPPIGDPGFPRKALDTEEEAKLQASRCNERTDQRGRTYVERKIENERKINGTTSWFSETINKTDQVFPGLSPKMGKETPTSKVKNAGRTQGGDGHNEDCNR